MRSDVIAIIATVLSIVATILAFVFIVPEKRRAKLNGFGKFLHDTFNFKFLVIEKILQACYILATAYMVCFGFFALFAVEERYSYYYSSSSEWVGYYGLIILIVGPIAVRLGYELLMMAVLLVKNVIQINNKIKNDNGEVVADTFKTPIIEKTEKTEPVEPAKPEGGFCFNCGAKADGTFCTNCGTKLK